MSGAGVITNPLTRGPLAAARLRTETEPASQTDDDHTRRRGLSVSRESMVFVAAAALVALMVAFIGMTMPRTSPEVLVGTPDEVRVIESDLTEPFIVCTIRAGITRCKELDLNGEQP